MGQNIVLIFGKVQDVKIGEVFIGVNICLEGIEKGFIIDIDGFYEILGVILGSYNIIVSYLGYQIKIRSNVII